METHGQEPRPMTSDPQLVHDSGLNYWAIKLLAESAERSPVMAHFGELTVKVGNVEVTIKRLPPSED